MTVEQIIERENLRAAQVWKDMTTMPVPIGGYEPTIQRHLLAARAEQIREMTQAAKRIPCTSAELLIVASWGTLATALEAAGKGV